MMAQTANKWGGRLHEIAKEPCPGIFCFECSAPLKKGDYVHIHFGGMVIIHRKCAHDDIEYADCEKEDTHA